ncbi:MAG: hypothetical protein JW883_06455 [Deltaproteobacteria bacterium]|nr:hypothetical protein [Deltaproteobacteria bacterium]
MHIQGARAVDWEDIAAFTWQGKDWLVVADVGNNRAKPRESVLYVLEEPALRPDKAPEDLTIPVAWQLTFRYVDGPRDCEAMAVDVASNRVFLLPKRTVPAVLYTLPLRPDGKGHLVAHPSVEFTHLRQPTAMDLAPDGRGRWS